MEMHWGWRRCALLAALALAGCGDDEAAERDAAIERDASAEPDAAVEDAARDASDEDASEPLPESDDPARVFLHDGELEGDVAGDAVRFLKIPYGKPPVGALRWKAPEPSEPWEGVRHETEFSTPCPQPPSQQSPASMDEDCLYLNVWRPNELTSKAPVMVWIHGGGFTTGSAADKVPLTVDHLWYDGQKFAERGVIVVTLNYRLGVMGFFAHAALEDEGAPVGNQGLYDQRLALQWVQRNIAQFGGDPDNVTIFGESAGAGSVCMHVASPGSRGLFHRAVSQSGGCTTRRTVDRETLDMQLAMFASERGCEGDGEEVLECLRALPVAELVSMEEVDRTMGMSSLRSRFSFTAVVDGDFLPEPAAELFDRGEVAQVPYILGSNTEESRLYFISAVVPTSDEEYEAEITTTYGDFAERVLELYPITRFDGNYRRAMEAIASDSGLICGTLDTARRAHAAGLPVYMYNFNIPWSISTVTFGASHASEISHVFGTPYRESEANIEVAEVMNAYWASFAEDGDPNYDGAPASWPAFEPTADGDYLRLQLDPEFETLESFRKEECDFWAEYAAAQE